ncbi:MAG: transglycosylase domain-containing protein, partial [Amphiplicatus sp.]
MAVRKKSRRRNSPRRGVARRPRGADRLSLIAGYAANAGVILMTLFAMFAAFIAVFARDLPSTDGLWTARRAPRMTLVALDGAPIEVHGVSVGTPVRLVDLPVYAPQAVLAVEDRNFYHHIGVNPIAVARALIVNAGAGEVRQGGSTITQQLAKNLFLSSDRTLKRKIQELILALWLERQFTKDEILTLYLNRVYFGAGAYGLDAAAHRYFAKSPRALTLGESAVLAGLLKAPSRYAPTRNPEDAGTRARLVLDAMEQAKFITHREADKARAAPVLLAAASFTAAPYFVDHILQETHSLARGVDADLVVRTTFDPGMQRALEEGIAAGLAKAPLTDDIEAAAVILDGEGAVRAMLGGRDYEKSQFNRATQARRQPGSAFKPFVFLAALEAGLTPQTSVLDAPIRVDNWAPDNYGGRYFGEVSLRNALAFSLNSATVRLQE